MHRFGLLASRWVLWGYRAVYGAQKLFRMLGGHGLGATAVGFNSSGLRPGKAMGILACVGGMGGTY